MVCFVRYRPEHHQKQAFSIDLRGTPRRRWRRTNAPNTTPGPGEPNDLNPTFLKRYKHHAQVMFVGNGLCGGSGRRTSKTASLSTFS